jgi:UDP-N-acetyl-D-glucosamine dehydrogenase
VNTVDSPAPFLRPGQLLSLESTTYPGTTDEELFPRIAAPKLEVGRDFFLGFSPEREFFAEHETEGLRRLMTPDAQSLRGF